MNYIFSLISFAIIIGVTIPYMVDIKKGRARPSRAARGMLFLLVTIALFQQIALGSTFAIALTVGETLSGFILLWLSFKHGVGGTSKSDLACYVLLALSLIIWYFSKNALIALHISMIADTVAFWPTLEKTWRDPKSETALFFWGGVIAPIFSILAQSNFSYSIIVFPIYISLANLIEVGLISGRRLQKSV
jgi:hypothetical protein